MEQVLLGQVLLNLNLITESQLEIALADQAGQGINKPLGEVLLEQGAIDQKTLSSILNVQKRRNRTAQPHKPSGPKASASNDLGKRLRGAAVSEYLRVAAELGATDIYLTSGMRPLVRLHGNLVDLEVDKLDMELCRALVFPLLSEEEIEAYYRDKSVDLNYEVEGLGRFRLNVFRHFGGLAAVFRAIPNEIPTVRQLGLPKIVQEFVRWRQGLVLITGPTGSGKTTTLTALLHLINESFPLHVVTLEDPIETVFESKKALITQRDVRHHSVTFSTALSAALREDPDVIVVGEMRDPQTIATALTAAETGHLVFGTLHTRNAQSTVLRIVDQFPAQRHDHVRSMLASTLKAIVCQELVPHVDGRGRSVACEVLRVNAAASNLIRENRLWQIPNVMQMGANEGMVLMDDALRALVTQKRVSLDEALSRAVDKTKLLNVS